VSAFHRVLGAVGYRIDIPGSTANSVARSRRQTGTNQHNRHKLTNHGQSSLRGRNDNGRNQVALSTAFAAEFTSVAAPRTVLHAETASEPPINTKVITLRSIQFLLSLRPHATRGNAKALHCATPILSPLVGSVA
jgi:hypothetical protein